MGKSPHDDFLQAVSGWADYNAKIYQSCALILTDMLLIVVILMVFVLATNWLSAAFSAPVFCLASLITFVPFAVIVLILLRWGFVRGVRLIKLIFMGR